MQRAAIMSVSASIGTARRPVSRSATLLAVRAGPAGRVVSTASTSTETRSSVSAGNVEPRQLTAEIVTTGGAIIALAAGLTFAQGVHAAEGLSDLAGQAQHVPNSLMDLAENENFWANVFAYVRYFFSVLLGTAYVAVKPLQGLMKNPFTAVLVVSAGVLVVLGVNFTIRTMTGLNDDFIYEPSSMVTNRPI